MFKQAWREVRLNPGRYFATLIAIAISIAFMAAVSIFTTTQSEALGRMSGLSVSKADVVVVVNDGKDQGPQVRAAIASVPGVDKVERLTEVGGSVSLGDKNAYTTLYGVPSDEFRWAKLASGRWPSGKGEIVASAQLAKDLGAKLGDTLTMNEVAWKVVGISDDAPVLFMQIAYAAPEAVPSLGQESALGKWIIKTSSTADSATVADAIKVKLKPLETANPQRGNVKQFEVQTQKEALEHARKAMTDQFDVMKYMLLSFSAIAAVVGTIIVANTFTILLAQRRRQIGLLRAVGASGPQVRGRFFGEAVVVGALGSLLGLGLGAVIAYAGAAATKASWFGLFIPWTDLAVEFGVGIVLTVVAAFVPSLKATRVLPLEALRPVATSEQVKKASIVRGVLCALLIAGGAALAAWSFACPTSPDAFVGPVLYAILGSALLTFGVLGAAPLYVPLILRGLGSVIAPLGATARLAGENSVRNPRRSAATATALMLATGLIVTLHVGVATAERTILTEIERRVPIDVTVTYMQDETDEDGNTVALKAGFTPALVDQVSKLPNLKAAVALEGGMTQLPSQGHNVLVQALPANASSISELIPTSIADDEVWRANDGAKNGDPFTIIAADGSRVTLKTVLSKAPSGGTVVVSNATMKKLIAEPKPVSIWLKIADREKFADTSAALQKVQKANPGMDVGGRAAEAYAIQEVLRILLLVTTALLGVAVVIALIGVGNTLGLSVIERARESALLRALGMQQGSLRLMLLYEALLVALSGVLVGVGAGAFFGWLGMASIMRQSVVQESLVFAVDAPMTAGMIGVAVLAAGVASILPGRRAAKATPTEALAAE